MTQNILLDPSIRDWVLFPLIALVIFVGILKHYASILMKTSASPKMETMCCANTVNCARHLLSEGRKLPSEAFQQRVKALREGPLKKKIEVNPMEIMNDPTVLGDMMKGNVLSMLPSMGMMMLVSYFFSGFVVAKFPFVLASRFRGMMQRGVEIDDLDCNYVTSLSMYFLIMFGSNSVLQLLLGEGGIPDENAMMMNSMSGGGPQQPVDYNKVFKSLSDELEYAQDKHRWVYGDAPRLLLEGK
ncbi:Integral membrane protein DUF106, putative [Trypanosoma equiperdum]|uniref:ER membrane protein complex subunit 3 n=4 Tax=Trypanozoon TaxID=39700 RepID=Q38BC5_TRYB2|nr:hypothetical protein, conserved [Trypanosoma brucei gambiense DAL972]XP_822723.1 hypothetical protein, conserved [Trypanosoma brucei brucei TREU927]RHW69458.1 Integral membrane protein DUF106 [Trypanosoma brucei equiperdum]SCU67384.1 Integral membrane protein DUF106, putative [Trypanosoma equiperdum]EAN77895.1 hypothetical protein, conserved [Trypanosoma brucei brucei TREU927]CBH15494.1 hypothetical protein, conserved [Trypanosoma brucei gambiense DAL972]|eukprot:XP_011777758.1 hypothetical protein, conserved [Trypanosoma brucei gambiense DAL972]